MWDKYQIGSYQKLNELVGWDTFLGPQRRSPFELVQNSQTVPSLYVSTPNKIYPIFAQTRTGALPYVMVRELAQITDPQFALTFFTWACAIGSLVFALLYINSSSGLALPFMVLAITAPQWLHYLYAQYPDGHFAILLIFATLFCLQRIRSNKSAVLVGLLAGICVYVKLSSLMYFPIFVFFHWKQIKDYKKPLLVSFLSIVFAFLLIFLPQDARQVFFEQRTLIKNPLFYFEAFAYVVLEIFSPNSLTGYIFNSAPSIFETIKNQSMYFYILFLSHIALTAYLIKCHIKKHDFFKIILVVLIQVIVIASLSYELDDDFFDYSAQITLIFFTLIFYSAKSPPPNMSRKMILLFTSIVFLRLINLFSWNQGYQNLLSENKDCTHFYDCMLNDWEKNHWIQNKRLLTLNILDVGQIEFFSKEQVIPIHLHWKFERPPKSQELEDFLFRFPDNDFLILNTKYPEDRSLEKYLNCDMKSLIEKFKKNGISVEVLQEYPYPKFYRTFQLLRFYRSPKSS